MNTINKIQVDGVDYDIQTKELTKVTYVELKEMRDNGSLAAGHLYRITDYEFTTKQSNTKSAGHPFDVIVLATAENQLSELARAIQHEGDTYFDGNDLGAWELWYDLDNDTNKYEWADTTNGKGVIYRMIDEKHNDCPYDFKNALFYNGKLTYPTTADKYYYTFSYVVKDVLYDGTVETQVKDCYGNSMGVYLKRYSNKKSLNLNVFRNTSFGDACHSNTFGYNCYYNNFLDNCHSNTFGYNCYSNKFGSSCQCNTFSYNCYANIFSDTSRNNNFGSSCHNNTFGESISNRELNLEKTSITLNDEYYDDGGGQLVPIKHPDLSTQPSILPYKFMGQYVYEQLVVTNIDSSFSNSSSIKIIWPSSLDKGKIYLDIKAILAYNSNGLSVAIPIVACSSNESYLTIDGRNIYEINIASPIYLHVVYTSMPKEGGDYYGYNNY